MNSQIILQCKCKSLQKPTTIKWFKKKDESYNDNNEHAFESYQSFVESSRSIKYFENFYEPMSGSGLKELNDNVLLSKLIVNEITESSTFVCVAINYFGFSFRENFVNVLESENEYEIQEKEEIYNFPEKNYEILFLIPVVLLFPISMLIFTILYLWINRNILKRNKSPETIFL
jgi:hypothetical protein